MNTFRTAIVLFVAALTQPSHAQLTFSFADAQVDLDSGVASIDLLAEASQAQFEARSQIGLIGQFTSTIRFDLLGDIQDESISVSGINQLPYPTSLFFSPNNGMATATNASRSTFTVVGIGGDVSFESVTQDGPAFAFLSLEFALADFLTKDVAVGSIRLTVEDIGSPSFTSIGSVGNPEPPFANDPLFDIQPSGGTTETPTIGPSHTLVLLSNIPGDFDADSAVSAMDIDILTSAIRIQDDNIVFDLNNDTVVNSDDRDFMIESLIGTRAGDTDVDFDVDFSDFLKLSRAFGMSGGWADGDFNGDGVVDFPDFLELSRNFGQANLSVVASVPEPRSWWAFVALPLVIVRKRRSS